MSDKYVCALGFERGHGCVSNLIRLFTRPDEWTPSHTYLYRNNEVITETHMFSGVRNHAAACYALSDIKVYRPRFLSFTSKQNMLLILQFMVGDAYGYGKLPLFMLDGIFGTYAFTQFAGISNFKACSNLNAWLFAKTPKVHSSAEVLEDIARAKVDHPHALGYNFGTGWKSATPNSMQNWCETHPEDWEEINPVVLAGQPA